MIKKKDKTVIINEPLANILLVVSNAYARVGLDTVITSGNDATHKKGSLHYKDRALDFRTRTIPQERVAGLVKEIKIFLGPQYDVVLEKDHLHVEYDPPT